MKASVGVALDTAVAKPSSLERVSVDTTVQPEAIAHPSDSRLYWKALQILVRQAKRHGLAGGQGLHRQSLDGHTLAATLDQATSLSGVAAERIYVDKG